MSNTVLHVKAEAKDVKTSELYKDLKKYTMAFAKEYVQVGADELTREAQNAMNMFYGDYSPIYYNRTDDLRSNSYSKYIHNNGRYYYGGVKISADGMSPYYHGQGESVPASMIANMGWHGWHGPMIQTAPPLDYLTELLQSIEEKATEKATKLAEGLSYSVIEFI